MAVGVWPERRPDGSPWHPGQDDIRAPKSGSPLSFSAALVAAKGDWAEYAHTWGLKDWRDLIHPCPHCLAPLGELDKDESLNSVEWPWEEATIDTYVDACTACEVVVGLTQADLALLRPHLSFDRRTRHGFRGLSLRRAFPQFGLIVGDRVEPSQSVRDVGLVLTSTEPLLEVTFWRQEHESRCKHRNPLMDPLLGFSPERLLVDHLHAFNLGCLKEFCTSAMWEMVLSNAFDLDPGMTEPELVSGSCDILALELSSFVSRYRRAHPLETITEPQKFTKGMIGTATERCLRTKAHETKTYALFLAHILRQKQRSLTRGDLWVNLADGLCALMRLLHDTPLVVPDRAHQACLVCSSV